ncbi:MAG: endonuclease I family protein [Candidatus Izemoplasmatales bacterium]
MKKKLTMIISIIVFIIAVFIYLDSSFELGLVDKIERQFDTQAPEIKTDNLRAKYLLNENFNLDVECIDNLDDACEVIIIGDFSTQEEGNFQVELIATDNKGNSSSFIYEYAVVKNADGSMYIPLGYYDGIDNLEGEALKEFLNEITKNHRVYPYTDDQTDVWDILRAADQDPNNENNVIGFYTGLSIPKDCQDTNNPPSFCQIDAYGESKIVEWNREHIWSKSRGFPTETYDAYTDAHHLVAAERVMNSIKNNRFFEDCHDGDDIDIEDRGYDNYTCNVWDFEPRDEIKGDVARMIFYMVIRYEDETLDLEIVNDPMSLLDDRNDDDPIYGDIDDLLRWHIEDPVSEKEILRNELIFSYQGNRNPFIDLPSLVELIWGSHDEYQE